MPKVLCSLLSSMIDPCCSALSSRVSSSCRRKSCAPCKINSHEHSEQHISRFVSSCCSSHPTKDKCYAAPVHPLILPSVSSPRLLFPAPSPTTHATRILSPVQNRHTWKEMLTLVFIHIRATRLRVGILDGDETRGGAVCGLELLLSGTHHHRLELHLRRLY
jgi:hypothetical protein